MTGARGHGRHWLLSPAALAVASAGLIGCSSPLAGPKPDAADLGAGLEQQITMQLPGEARRLGLGPVVVEGVTCVSESETKYSCIAEVRGVDFRGRYVNESVPIDGTCDEQGCIWRSNPGF